MERNDPTDADLVCRTLSGNREAFGCLFDRHARMVRAVVGAVSLDWSAVEDMTQESFLRAYRNLPKLREHRQFGAWVVGIARQVARERKRSLRRDRHEFNGKAPLETASSFDGTAEVDDAEQSELLMRKLATLPERERLAIHAFFLQEHNSEQAANLLELSRSGFYAVLKKALAHLRGLVQRHDSEEEAKR
jgi:RNA polymerase sigma-70 factor (ECF subfamily)